MEKRKVTSVEKSVQRTLFYQRLVGGIVATTLGLVLVGVYVFWAKQHYQTEHVDEPNYAHLDETSPTYWADRVDTDIASIQRLEISPQLEFNRLRHRLQRTLATAATTTAGYDRSVAVSETALAIFRNNINIDVEEFLQATGETPLAMALRAKVLVANALMLLRLNDKVAATVTMNNYERLVIAADVKIDTEAGELAFRGAAKVYRYTFDVGSLDALFQRNLKFTPRITDVELRMKAYRIIATEQAVAGRDRDAMETVAQIDLPIELVRAFQGVIINVARPEKPDLTEPTLFLPKINGPWEPLPQPRNAKRIINDVLHHIASRESTVSDQVDLLMRLAGSRMVCDPDLYTLLKSCLTDSGEFDDIVKRPVIQRLQNPESSTIRNALNMPPSTKKKDVDSAQDSWTSPHDDDGDVEMSDPTLLKEIVELERLRIQLAVARSYLAVNRRRDAVLSLQQAFKIAEGLTDIRERIAHLLDVVGLQIIAGDFIGSRNTFTAIGLPKRVDSVLMWSPSDSEVAFSGESVEMSLARLVRLEVLARFLDDAELTINLLPTGNVKDEESVFLVAELIRTQRLREATRVIVEMTEGPQKTELMHRLEIAKGGSEENYRCLNIAFPEKTPQNDALVDAAVSLLQLGLYDAARKAVERMSNTEDRTAPLLRILRDLLIFYTAYGSTENEHQAVRKTLLDIALRTANAIDVSQDHVVALEMILSTVIPLAREKAEQESLLPVVRQALEMSQKIPNTIPTKAGTVAKLLSGKILLYTLTNSPSPSPPALAKELDQEIIDEIMDHLADVLEFLNEVASEHVRAQGMLAVARVLGQIGRTNQARKLLDSVLEIARSQNDKRIAVSLFLGTIPQFVALSDLGAARSVYYDVFTVVDNIPDVDPTGGNAAMIFGTRLRDSEIDRLARSLLEYGFISEAVLFAGRRSEGTTLDPLLQHAVFQLIDKGNFADAENTAHRHGNADIRAFLLRSIAFAKRHKGRG